MPDRRSLGDGVRLRRSHLPTYATALAALLLLAGALVWFRPFLTRAGQPIASVASPAAMSAATAFSLPPRKQACMNSVALEPDGRIVEFQLGPIKATPRGKPTVELVLRAPSYRVVAMVPGNFPGGVVALAIAPPRRSEIGTACFVNRAHTTVNLIGTIEPRTVSRSTTTIGGRQVVGDIALTFADSRSRSLLDRLGEAFGHASNLTDRLVPVWLIWVLTVLVALGLPLATLAAFHLALREDQSAGRL